MRGQAALEFLLSYGWAILSLLAVIGVLGYFMGAHTFFLPNKCVVAPPFSCVESKAAENGVITLGLQNAVEELDYARIELYCNSDPAENRSFVEPGLLEVQGRINDSVVHFSCPLYQGNLFRAEFTIEYRNLGEKVTHDAEGSLRLHVEP